MKIYLCHLDKEAQATCIYKQEVSYQWICNYIAGCPYKGAYIIVKESEDK